MADVLTMDEIKARYAPDWVLIADPVVDDLQHVHAGRVVFHGPDRDQVYEKAIELRLGHFAFRYLGERPSDMEFALSLEFLAVP